MNGFVAWTDHVIENLRLGIDKGIVLPKVVVEAILPQLAEIGVEDPRQSVFWRPILEFSCGTLGRRAPADSRPTTRACWAKRCCLPIGACTTTCSRSICRTRVTVRAGRSCLPAMSGTPTCVRLYTTTERYACGGARARSRRGRAPPPEMERVAGQLGHQGDLRSLLDALRADPRFRPERPEALLDGYGALRDRVNLALPVLFAIARTRGSRSKPWSPIARRRRRRPRTNRAASTARVPAPSTSIPTICRPGRPT